MIIRELFENVIALIHGFVMGPVYGVSIKTWALNTFCVNQNRILGILLIGAVGLMIYTQFFYDMNKNENGGL